MSTLEPQPELLRAAADQARQRQQAARRKRAFIALAAVVAVGGAASGGYAWFTADRSVSTDNAYVATETAQVTPAIAGIVRDVQVADTHTVRRGDVVVRLDDTDASLALAQAEAELGRAVRRVRTYVANDGALAAQIASRLSEQQRAEAQLQAAQADFERAQIDFERREALSSSGSVSGDELTRARNAFDNARAALLAAQAQVTRSRADHAAAIGSRSANAALIAGSTEDNNPEVALARARRDQARVHLERTVIRAPVDGVVARRVVQVGQQVQAGMPLLSVVPLREVHVDANFKEVQLQRVRVGQRATVTSDLYGRHVVYHGTVAGLAGGTGAAFATIPAQNATGNWIKVVQRVPVRIALDPDELAARPLQVGLSMTATIDTRGAAR